MSTAKVTLWHEIRIELFKFVLIFIFGGAITLLWQSLDHRFVREAEQEKYKKEQATIAFEQSSELLGRVILSFRLASRGKGSADELQKTYFEWNINFPKNKTLLMEYFGVPAESMDNLDHRITTIFTMLSNGNLAQKVDGEDPETSTNHLDNDVLQLNSLMVDSLIKENASSEK